ncbi:MAG: hypothetical protein NZ992_04565 [Candidatus Korarchaeum sp.]|nr:hypothetical protein [Candidatus Korarchaeum sp.]MDW8035113.1 hypothetical protein [Candidatus Korarchaeum sp.]
MNLKYVIVQRCDPDHYLTETGPLMRLNSILERRIGSEWVILTHFTEDSRRYNFGLCVEFRERPSDDSLVELSLGSGEMRVAFPWREIVLSNPSIETLIPLDISLMSIFSFQNPQFVIGEMLISKVLFYTNPSIWSDPSLVGSDISSTYRRLSEELDLERRYCSFARALQFLSGIDHLPEIIEAFKALSSLGIAPPTTRAELLQTPDLSPAEIKVLRVLCVKEAIDRIPNLSDRQMATLLLDLARVPSGPQRVRVQRSLSSRGMREGLTLAELALTVGIDKTYLWRYVIPKMIDSCLIRVGKDASRGKEVRVYRANPYITFLSDLIMTYSMRISHLLSRRIL